MQRPQKITIGGACQSGVRGLLIYCQHYKCSRSIAIGGDAWPDDGGLSDLEPRFVSWVIGMGSAGNHSLTIFRHRVEQVWNWTA